MKGSETDRMKALVSLLNEAGKAYYQEAREIMSNYEYDRLYDELTALEQETGTILANSPTINVGYEVLSELPKEPHESRMLSLNKTKEVSELAEFAGSHKVLVSWKLDGLTIVLTYRGGELYKAVTRGNGETGEVVTSNARVFANIPLRISHQGELIIRGEAVISYSEFEKINAEIPEAEAKYKNPRNLCSGSVRQLNNEITAKRKVSFFAFSLVSAEGAEPMRSREQQMEWLAQLGFEVVEYRVADASVMEATVAYFAGKIETNDFPSDGLVLTYDDIAYGQSLGTTAKFPRDSIAFKWEDETRRTHLLEIEWSASRTGLINPVAIFEPVELEGTTVSRASVHNISIMRALELGIGDEIEVYKANMIIPQIAENLTRSGMTEVPAHCPVCSGDTKIRRVRDVETLYCLNEECQAKQIKAFALFVSRDALNIEGMSEATLEKLIGRGFVKEFADLFKLSRYRDEIAGMEGFGEKSCENMIASAERARETTLARVVYGLGIPNIGTANAKVICKAFDQDLQRIIGATVEELSSINGVGEVMAKAFVEFFQAKKNLERLKRLLQELRIQQEEGNGEEQDLEGLNFVITGSVEQFANRKELKEHIEARGGKVTGSVTSKTNYLINNDVNSSSSKNKKAKELGIPILAEQDFLAYREFR